MKRAMHGLWHVIPVYGWILDEKSLFFLLEENYFGVY